MLSQLLLLSLANQLSLLLMELRSLLLGLQLLPVLLGLLLLLLLSFSPPRKSSYVFAVLSSERWWGACHPARALISMWQLICTLPF